MEAAVQAVSGRAPDAWAGAADWNRDSDFLTDLANAVGLTADQVDKMFRAADAIRG